MQETKVPGEDTTLKSKVLCAGAGMLGKFTPLNQICDHVVALHCYSEEVKRQVLTHHYCSKLNEDFRQCILYDSDKADARLIGIEYVISHKLFNTLPDEEKKYWHSHVFEIKSGLLAFPEVPNMVEKEAMKELISTYGKAIHFWEVDKGHSLPLGEPKLIVSTAYNEMVDWNLLNKSFGDLKLDYKEIAKSREDINEPVIDPMVDQWVKSKKGICFKAESVDLKKC
jgi:hypothetical protein